MCNEKREFIEKYKMLNDQQKETLFTKEQRQAIDAYVFFEKMFNDPALYKAVEQAVGEAVYEEFNQQEDYPVTSRILFYEKNTDGEFNKTPIRYEAEEETIDGAIEYRMDLMWEAIEIEGFDDSELYVEFELEENGEYVDRDEYFVTLNIVRTEKPSKYINWRGKEPHIFEVDREKSKIIFEDVC